MKDISQLLHEAQAGGRSRLSEYESKKVLAAYGIPTVREIMAEDLHQVRAAAYEIGYPVVLKACSAEVAHKTESALIRLDIRNEAELSEAFNQIQSRVKSAFLVQEMIKGHRELVVGMVRDHQFGPCVMFGTGGIFTEALGEVCFRAAPLSARDALEMMQETKAGRLLGELRGLPAVDHNLLCRCLISMGQIGLEHKEIIEIDANPIIITGDRPVAVDALVVLGGL
ncbi:MAG: acetate--CoA ligase family protein [Deltaproteobacteria bacterium]|nr:acetate--CoA ligase family protein [Deltaproteobacteria bacterium]MBW2152751.1 acetate--CoA ligase family protein [Deltaproteobacteria bacterium]